MYGCMYVEKLQQKHCQTAKPKTNQRIDLRCAPSFSQRLLSWSWHEAGYQSRSFLQPSQWWIFYYNLTWQPEHHEWWLIEHEEKATNFMIDIIVDSADRSLDILHPRTRVRRVRAGYSRVHKHECVNNSPFQKANHLPSSIFVRPASLYCCKACFLWYHLLDRRWLFANNHSICHVCE